MESHDHLRLRDTRWDKDLFVILSWSSSGAFLESFILTRTFRHLDVIILPLLRCVFFIRGSDSVMDSDDEDRTPEDRWLEAIWFFWPITHLMPYWGIFSFWLRFVDLHWFAWSSLVTRCTSGWWFASISPWFSGGAFLKTFDWACIF